MKVIKRDGHMVDWCPEKIEQAIIRANADVEEDEGASNAQIKNIIKYIEGLGKKRILVEDIQDIIEMKLMSQGKYALAKKLSEKHEIYVTPSSDTLKEFAVCLDIREDNISELLEFVMENGIDMTIPISQTAINSDIATKFAENKQAVFAPCAKANEITYNKVNAKKLLYKLRINTPKFGIFEKQNLAIDYVKTQKKPFVIKTNDRNSAVVLTSEQIAKNIIDTVFIEKNKKVIIEDYVYGTPFSFYTVTDGYKALPIGSSISYKHMLDGEGGQLTEGMGSCVPNYKLTLENEYYLMDNVIYPALDYLEISNKTYLGILGVNGILTENGNISILGWHSFLQDCDAAAILNNIEEDLYSLFEACIIGSFSDEIDNLRINEDYHTSVVLNCTNKETDFNTITGLDKLDESTVVTYYPTVNKNRYLELEANKGPVAIITQKASTPASAAKRTYDEIKDIGFKGIYYRKDICK